MWSSSARKSANPSVISSSQCTIPSCPRCGRVAHAETHSASGSKSSSTAALQASWSPRPKASLADLRAATRSPAMVRLSSRRKCFATGNSGRPLALLGRLRRSGLAGAGFARGLVVLEPLRDVAYARFERRELGEHAPHVTRARQVQLVPVPRRLTFQAAAYADLDPRRSGDEVGEQVRAHEAVGRR